MQLISEVSKRVGGQKIYAEAVLLFASLCKAGENASTTWCHITKQGMTFDGIKRGLSEVTGTLGPDELAWAA